MLAFHFWEFQIQTSLLCPLHSSVFSFSQLHFSLQSSLLVISSARLPSSRLPFLQFFLLPFLLQGFNSSTLRDWLRPFLLPDSSAQLFKFFKRLIVRVVQVFSQTRAAWFNFSGYGFNLFQVVYVWVWFRLGWICVGFDLVRFLFQSVWFGFLGLIRLDFSDMWLSICLWVLVVIDYVVFGFS